MLDTSIKVEKKEAKIYPPLPENIYQVELLDVTSKEVETYNSKMGKTEETEHETVMSFQYTLLAGQDLIAVGGVEDLRGRNIWANFIPTYLYVGKNGKNNLYKIIEALLGRLLTPEEDANGVDGAFLNELIGKQCRVGTKHKRSGDKIFDNIDTYYAIEGELPKLTDEEKESASVKEKKEEVEEVKTPVEDTLDVPFV